MGAEVADMQMLGIELFIGFRHILAVEAHTGASDNQRVDAEIEWGMAQCVLWCQ